VKVQHRTVPMDCLHVRKGGNAVIITTHRHTISIATYSDDGLKQEAWHEFTFDQLFNFIGNLRDGIAEMHNPLPPP